MKLSFEHQRSWCNQILRQITRTVEQQFIQPYTLFLMNTFMIVLNWKIVLKNHSIAINPYF